MFDDLVKSDLVLYKQRNLDVKLIDVLLGKLVLTYVLYYGLAQAFKLWYIVSTLRLQQEKCHLSISSSKSMSLSLSRCTKFLTVDTGGLVPLVKLL